MSRAGCRALRAEGTLAVVLNAANEVAVAAFLEGRLGRTAIPTVIERTMNAHTVEGVSTVETAWRVDGWAHTYARDMAAELELTV